MTPKAFDHSITKEIRLILRIAQNHWDEGPPVELQEEGWQSDKLKSACARVVEWLKVVDPDG